MTRGRKKKKSSNGVQFLALAVVLLVGFYAVRAFAEKLSPEEGLLRIVNEQNVTKDYDSALKTPLIAIGKNELADLWGRIVLARKLDQLGEKRLAAELLQAAEPKFEKGTSAAAFEALLLLNRLRLEQGQKVLSPENFEQASKLTELYRRRDLEAETLYSTGLYQLQKKELELARITFLSLRERFPSSTFAKSARALKDLLVSKPDLREIELLIKEGELQQAETALTNFQQSRKDTPEFFQSLLTKDSLLRKQKKPKDADELLNIIARDAPEGSASTALLQSAKNAWNENDTLGALEFLDQLFKRFPKSTVIPDAHYTEARILEELGKLRDAEKIYEEPIKQLENTSGDNKEVLRLVKNVKRAVWLKFARGAFDDAVKLSERVIKAISPLASDSELRSEGLGLNYWAARSLKELKGDSNQSKATELFTSVFQADRRTFYGALSKAYLETTNSSKLSFFSPPIKTCQLMEVEALKSRLNLFNNPKLRVYAQHEIDFAFGGLRTRSVNSYSPAFLASQSQLSSTQGQISSGIELAEEGLKIGKKEVGQFACDSELAALAYPTPFLEQYRKAQKSSLVSLPLVLAISRSESYFDPEAKSPVGALGLMQLMPDTAKLEGWKAKPELTDPGTNITLGVKHLKRLLNNFDGDIYKVAASYNAGSGAVNRWSDRYGIFPSDLFVEFIGNPETNKYVRRVFAAKKIYAQLLAEQQK